MLTITKRAFDRMFYRIVDFELPTLGAIGVELARLANSLPCSDSSTDLLS